MIELRDASLDRDRLLEALHARGVWMGPSGPRRIRAICHLDIDDAGVARAIEAFQGALGALVPTGGGDVLPSRGSRNRT